MLGSSALLPYWLGQLPLFYKLREMFLYVVFHKKWDFDNLVDWQESMYATYKNNIENDIPFVYAQEIMEK